DKKGVIPSERSESRDPPRMCQEIHRLAALARDDTLNSRAMIRICLAGATGWVGRPLAEAIQESGDLALVAAVARSAGGQRIGEIAISGSVEEALRTPSDVFIDYTSATAVKNHVMLAIDAG